MVFSSLLFLFWFIPVFFAVYYIVPAKARNTVLFMGRPFLPQTFLSFVEQLESSLTHPVTLIYWVDQQSGYLLKIRSGWEMQMREKITRIHGIRIAKVPQGFSIWTYDPNKREKTDAGNEQIQL